MKQFLFILLVCTFPTLIFAQDASMKVYANGEEKTGLVEITEYRRMTILVEDDARRDGSVVYEFGPVQIYSVNAQGERVLKGLFREAEVVNMPTLNFGLSPKQNPELLGHFELEVEWVKRYNLDKSVDLLKFEDANRTFPFYLHK